MPKRLPFSRLFGTLGFGVFALVACDGASDYTIVSGPRDFATHPAIEQVEVQPTNLYAVSDVHGGYDRMAALFAKHGLTSGVPDAPGHIVWTGGTSILVVVGDSIDKGDRGVEVIDALMALEGSARSAGGRVIVLLGNHEAEFFVDPTNSKASAFDDELSTDGIAPEAIASGKDPRGAWLRDRPFGAAVGRWFFAHAGDTHGRSLDALETALEASLRADDYAGAEIVGDTSLFESRDWYSADATIGGRYAKAVSAEHIVFGHDPNALGPKGAIAVGQKGSLVRIDCGMSPAVNDSEGALLRVQTDGVTDVVDALLANGEVTHLL